MKPSDRAAWADDVGKLLLRLTVGVLLLFHGIAKVPRGVAWIEGPLGELGLPGFLSYGVYVGEIVAPVFLILGLWTRPAALVVAFNMFMAILLAHRDVVFSLRERGGGWAIEHEALFLFGARVLLFLGGGRYGLRKGRPPLD